MPYLVELVDEFAIQWHFNLKFFYFCHFSQKKVMKPLTKNEKIGQKINFHKSGEDR